MPADPELPRGALVTGGARGIGLEIAERLVADGYSVVAADLAEPDQAVPGIEHVEADVSDEAGVEALFAEADRLLDGLDVVVNNAGIWFRRSFAEITVEEWDSVVATNLRGVFLCSRAAVGRMVERGGGSIINIGSQAGQTITRGQGAHYHASKAAVAHLTRALAFELGPQHIRVNCVAPGLTLPEDTGIELPEAILGQIPLGRPGRPADVAEACAWFASSAADFVTGQVLTVNGGAVALL